MKSTTLENHSHTNPLYNCTHTQAWVLGWAISRWNWRNVLLCFRPPVLQSVAIIPRNKDLVDPDDRFTPDMFRHDGTFVEQPLNHYLRLQIPGKDWDFFVNAGFLLNQFLLGPSNGYATLKEMIQLAKEDYATSGTPEGSLGLVQEEGPSEPGRNPSFPGGVDH